MLAFENAQVLDVTGPLQLFAAVNTALKRQAYELVIAARAAGPFATNSGMQLVANAGYDAPGLMRNVDTLMVSGGEGTAAAMKDAALLKALKAGAKTARRVASVCSGALVLAQAGLLNGKRATTHWRAADGLAKNYPRVHVEPDAIFVRDGRIWSSAGVTAGMDLTLALIREDHGEAVALAIARQHVMYLVRPGGQSQFSTHLQAENFSTAKLAPLLRWIPEHIDGALDVPALAMRANMSERNFARLFQKETGITPAAYVEMARLDAARRLLTGSALGVETIAARTGFGSEERMRRVFQRHLKISPSAFRERFAMKETRP